MDDHFDTSGVFEISKFYISKFACIYIQSSRKRLIEGFFQYNILSNKCTLFNIFFNFFFKYTIQSNKCTLLLLHNFYSTFDQNKKPEPTLLILCSIHSNKCTLSFFEAS